MSLTDKTFKSEEKYLSTVEAFFKEKWGETKLWSHDLSHHRRVWNYAKELLQYIVATDQIFVDKLLIACYLHDIGMSIDPGEKHGIHSRKLCESFLEENNLCSPDHADLLQAIENHDNKDYTSSTSENKLCLLLSVADDLDAFGYTGICRFLEIYLKRGIDPSKISPLVLKNSAARFNNFINNFKNYPELVGKYRSRYMDLRDFFENLDYELSRPDAC
jgi:hypothetical protein